MTYKALFSSKLTVFILFILLAFLGSLKYRQWQQQSAIEREKQHLTEQMQALEKKNGDLEQSLSYLNSENFKERVARQQLNLKKPDEVVYGFSESQNSQPSLPAETQSQSNFLMWRDYFLHSTQ